jgi:hypothetical protein
MIIDKINKRKCRMVLFELEEALGQYVYKHNTDEVLADLNNESQNNTPIVDAVEKAYLDEIFQFSLEAAKGTTDLPHLKKLYNSFKLFNLYEVRNALAHPTRPFDDHYWFKVACLVSQPCVQILGLESVSSALISAEKGQLNDPPEDWLKKYTSTIPNNLPEYFDHAVTGLVGRNTEYSKLIKNLKSDRIPVNAIVAPGGIGKTALALEILSEVVSDPSHSVWCDGVFYSSMKTEKLTDEGVVQLQSAQTLDELKNELAESINESYDLDDLSFEEIIETLKNKKIILFLDNLETLLRDDLESFDELNEALPRNWQVLITSRITVPYKVLNLSELSDSASVELAKRYLTSRGEMLEINFPQLKLICNECFCNPLAIKLTLDLIAKGKEIPSSISIAKRDITEFSFSNLIEQLNQDEMKILECIFIEYNSTRQSIFALLETNYDDIASSISYLSKTSLIERNFTSDRETYSLPASIRELFLRSPKDLEQRAQINERYQKSKLTEKTIDNQQSKENIKPYYINHIPSSTSKDLKVLATDLFKKLKAKMLFVDVILGKSHISLHEATNIYRKLQNIKSAYEHDSLYHRCLALVYAVLKDGKAAKASLKKALSINCKDYSSSLLLGRLMMQDLEYSEAHLVYEELISCLDPQTELDEQYTRVCYSGLYLSLLYDGEYDIILKETKSWQDLKSGRSVVALLRASAHKRLAENEKNIGKFIDRIKSAMGIISQVFKDDGYGRSACFNSIKLIDEFTSRCGRLSTFSGFEKDLNKILDFCESNIPKIMNSVNADQVKELNGYTKKLIEFNYEGNPFKNRSWLQFISNEDRGLINHEEVEELGLLPCIVERIIKPKGILFSHDSDNKRYFSGVNSYQGTDKDNWYELEAGDKIAISVDFSSKGDLPTSRELYILK